MIENITVAIIEDAILDYELIVRELKKSFSGITTFRIENKASYLNLLQTTEIHAIIADFNVPGFGALPALSLLKEEGLEVPFIIVSGALGDEKAAETIREGAFDLVLKSNLARLAPTLKMAVRTFELKKLEDDRIKTANEAASLREQAMAVVSHDIKSPLNSIQLSLGIVQKKLLDTPSAERDESIRNYLTRMDRSVLMIKTMVVDYIDQLNIDSGVFKVEKALSRVDLLCKELNDVFAPIAEKKKIKFQVDCLSTESFGVFDYARIFQAIMNLIGNAIKFTPENGTVSLGFEKTGKELKFIVKDSGPGISEELHHRIFEKYWSVNSANDKTSAGLGLFITKAIVDAHGGSVRVESILGSGTSFIFTIPKGEISSYRKQILEAQDHESTAGNLIVLVEDDDDLHDLLKELLEKEGFEVISFQSGLRAHEELAKNTLKPSLIMVDYQLPGMNGAEIEKAVRQLEFLKHVPVLIASAKKDIEQLKNPESHTYVLKKPIIFSELTRTIKGILNESV